jgi:uncharacterized protein
MSEMINNRQEQLKKLIKRIHSGLSLEKAKVQFKEEFGTVTTEEITSMEHSLIEEGMPLEEVQGLCDVHAAVFEGSISDIHKAKDITDIPGHPSAVLREENKRIQQLLDEEIKPYINQFDKTSLLMLTIGFERLSEIGNHYSRKENLLFPGLEKRGVTSIPKVMWGVDNQIRKSIKEIISTLRQDGFNQKELTYFVKVTITKIEDMIMKEDNILLPLLSDTLSLYDWILADEGSDEIGYFLEAPKVRWNNVDKDPIIKEEQENLDKIGFDAGFLSQIEVNAILNTVPFDMTFIDAEGHVKYFTQGKERIFDRPKTIIGRHVNMCHPPQSVHVVDEIVNSFKSNKKDHEDFWIDFNKMFVHIRYYAVRDENGTYLGTLEVTQDIKPIRDLTGEKRLVE